MNDQTRTRMNPLVSVVISTYNGASFIGDTLSSILNQTHTPDEVVIVDDHSADHIDNVVSSVASQTSIPIRFEQLRSNTGGPSKPLNIGIARAVGEVILTTDQDDLMRPGRIAASLKALQTFRNSGFVIGRFAIMGSEEGDLSKIWPSTQFSAISPRLDRAERFSLLDSKSAFVALLSKNFAGSCSNFGFTKSLWEKVGGFDESISTCCDLDFILRVAIETPIVIINEVLFDYRWRDNSLNRSNLRKSELELTKVRLQAASAKPEWAGDQLQALEDDAVYAAKLALKYGDVRGLSATVRTLLASGELKALVKRRLGRSKT